MRGNESVYPVALFATGGGIHGCRIVHDATGCGHFVTSAEKGDLAFASPSFSSKRFYGRLRLGDWMNNHRAGEYRS